MSGGKWRWQAERQADELGAAAPVSSWTLRYSLRHTGAPSLQLGMQAARPLRLEAEQRQAGAVRHTAHYLPSAEERPQGVLMSRCCYSCSIVAQPPWPCLLTCQRSSLFRATPICRVAESVDPSAKTYRTPSRNAGTGLGEFGWLAAVPVQRRRREQEPAISAASGHLTAPHTHYPRMVAKPQGCGGREGGKRVTPGHCGIPTRVACVNEA